jgi:hypothetical protein
MASRQAFIEYQVCKTFSIEYVTIQTAVMQNRPYHTFPVSDIFYCDIQKNKETLSKIGYKSNGIVQYDGTVLAASIKDVKNHSEYHKKILYIFLNHTAMI